MFLIEIPICDLSRMFNGPQSYRWRKVSENKYVIIDGKRIVLIEQKKNRKVFVCSEDDFFDYWFNYFDCAFDYGQNIFTIKRFYKEIKKSNFFFAFMIKENRKHRMIRNDLFETMIYYCLDEQDRDQKFQNFLHTFGEKKKNSLEGLKITWFKFPDPEQIDISFDCGLSREERKRIKLVSESITEDKLERIRKAGEEKAYRLLEKVYNDKTWIKNVMLYSLGFKDMFPIDDKVKHLFKINGIRPQSFSEFKEVQGFLLQLMKVNNNGNNRSNQK